MRFDGSNGRLCDGVRDPMGFHSPTLLEDDIRTVQESLVQRRGDADDLYSGAE